MPLNGQTHDRNRYGSRLFLALLVTSFIWYSPSLALTDYVYFVVSGDSSRTEMTQGETLAWGANCNTGATMYWQIWYDIDGDSVPEMDSDLLVAEDMVTDGDTSSGVDNPDISPIPDGWYQTPGIRLGVAAGQYIFTATDLSDGTSSQRIIISNPMVSPPNQLRGHVIVPGHPGPDTLLENIWIGADSDVGFYSDLTDDQGYFQINVDAAGTGQIFYLESFEIPGFLSPGELLAVASGEVDNLDFNFVMPDDSVWGFVKDELGAIINKEVRIEALPWSSGTDTKVSHTVDGRYVIYFVAAERGLYELGTWDTDLLPDNVLPKRFWFSHDTIGSFQHDIICYQADSQLNIVVTENGVLPGHEYYIFGSSESIASETQGASGKGNDNVLALPVSTADPSGWQVYPATWVDQYPIPWGFYWESRNDYDLSPGDTAYIDFIGPMVRGTVVQDPEDEPISPELIWVGLNSNDGDYVTTLDPDGSYSFYPDNGAYVVGAHNEGFLTDPSWGVVNVSGGLALGPDFTLNRTHCRVTGFLAGVTLPLDSSTLLVSARTGSGASGYSTNAIVDSLTGAFSLSLCDGIWTIEPPYIEGYATPEPLGLTIGEIPDTLRNHDFDYGSAGCCGLYTSGYTGNTNCGSDGKRNLADVTRLIDRVFLSKAALCCEENGNVDGDIDGKMNLADVTRLIDHVFLSKAETAACE